MNGKYYIKHYLAFFLLWSVNGTQCCSAKHPFQDKPGTDFSSNSNSCIRFIWPLFVNFSYLPRILSLSPHQIPPLSIIKIRSYSPPSCTVKNTAPIRTKISRQVNDWSGVRSLKYKNSGVCCSPFEFSALLIFFRVLRESF
jgi:hypothetical protein